MNFFQFLHQNFNIHGLEFMNSLTENPILASMIFYMADLPIFVVPLFLVVGWIYYNYKKQNHKKETLLFVFYAMIFAILISLFIQQFVDIDRPENSIQNADRLILEHIPDSSFPSDHTSVGMAFIVALFLFGYGKIALFFTPFFILMVLSRIAGGLHWPLDIIAGTFVGVGSAFCVYKIQNIIILKKTNLFLLKIAGYFKL